MSSFNDYYGKEIPDEILTEWHDGFVRPARPGVYARKFADGVMYYSHWNGQFWQYLWSNVLAVTKGIPSNGRSLDQQLPWKGYKVKQKPMAPT